MLKTRTVRAIAIADEPVLEQGIGLRKGELLGFFESEQEAVEYSAQEFHGTPLRFEQVDYDLIQDIDRIYHREERLGFFKEHPEMIEKLYLAKDRHEAELIIARAGKGVTA